MKKIKLMLLSLLVIGAVGGAVAFKASKKLDTFLCGPSPILCPNPVDHLTSVDPGTGIKDLYCTDADNTTDCPFSVTTNI